MSVFGRKEKKRFLESIGEKWIHRLKIGAGSEESAPFFFTDAFGEEKLGGFFGVLAALQKPEDGSGRGGADEKGGVEHGVSVPDRGRSGKARQGELLPFSTRSF